MLLSFRIFAFFIDHSVPINTSKVLFFILGSGVSQDKLGDVAVMDFNIVIAPISSFKKVKFFKQLLQGRA